MDRAGLEVNCEEFLKMPARAQRKCLYENQVETLNIIRGYKFYQKINAIISSFLAVGVGILFKMHVKL